MEQQDTRLIRTEERARILVASHLGLALDKVREDSDFADDLGTDSLDSIELAMAVEEEFGVTMPDDEVDRIFVDGSFGQLVEWLGAQRTLTS